MTGSRRNFTRYTHVVITVIALIMMLIIVGAALVSLRDASPRDIGPAVDLHPTTIAPTPEHLPQFVEEQPPGVFNSTTGKPETGGAK